MKNRISFRENKEYFENKYIMIAYHNIFENTFKYDIRNLDKLNKVLAINNIEK